VGPPFRKSRRTDVLVRVVAFGLVSGGSRSAWRAWLRVDVGLKATSAQLGDVVAERGVPGREVVARCPGLARR
jgi:hypothetical protein